jgi:zinc transport system substrate-binding protein
MKHSFLFFLIVFFSLFLTGCQSQDSRESRGASESFPQQKDKTLKKPEIVASFYPLAFMGEQILGDRARVTNLAKNQEVHDFRPSPKDIITLMNADLVIYQGAELEPWAEDVIPQLTEKNIPVLEVSEHLKLYKMEEDEENHEGESHDDEKHEKEGSHDSEEGEDEHHHGEFDPHTWLDPVLAQDMVDEVRKKIEEIDPQNADIYVKNAESLKAKLQAFDSQFQDLSCMNNKAIISHDALGYLARRYDFTLHSISGLSPYDEPSAKILVELQEEAKEGMTHILTEENSVKRFAETLSHETGLKMLPIYTLETNTESFFSGYEKNFISLKTAFQCQ